MRKKKPKLSIVIPVYNEVKTIEMTLKNVFAQDVSPYEKEVIVVNDGSTDGTDKKLVRWKNRALILNKKNGGKGSALSEGFAKAGGDIILIQDADLEYNPSDYPVLLAPFENPRVNVVYGSRFLGPHLSTMFVYALGNKFVTFVTNVLYNTNITDMETGYKVFRRNVIHGVTFSAKRFDFEPEFTAKALLRGYQIYEVPISYYGRKFEDGKKLTWRDGIDALITLLRLRLFP